MLFMVAAVLVLALLWVEWRCWHRQRAAGAVQRQTLATARVPVEAGKPANFQAQQTHQPKSLGHAELVAGQGFHAHMLCDACASRATSLPPSQSPSPSRIWRAAAPRSSPFAAARMAPDIPTPGRPAERQREQQPVQPCGDRPGRSGSPTLLRTNSPPHLSDLLPPLSVALPLRQSLEQCGSGSAGTLTPLSSPPSACSGSPPPSAATSPVHSAQHAHRSSAAAPSPLGLVSSSLDMLRSELSLTAQPAERLLASLGPPPAGLLPWQPQRDQAVGEDGRHEPSDLLSAQHRSMGSGKPALSDWEVSQHELEISRRPDGSLWQIGAGGFGRVYKAVRFGVQPVAVKVLAPAAEALRSGWDDFRREAELLKACKDPNIVSFLGASLSPDFTLLVLEFCEGGALAANLRAGRVSWHKRGKQVAVDVARGLAYLHGRRLIHLDLKSSNILLDRHGHAKIGDLGLARIIAHERSAVTASIGTLDWAAPEVLLGQRCTEKADIYSFGVCLWEICTQEAPVRGRMRALHAPRDCPADVATIVADCMAPEPSARPSAQQLVQRLLAVPSALRPAAEPSHGGCAVAALSGKAERPPRPAGAAALASTSLAMSGPGQGATALQASSSLAGSPQQPASMRSLLEQAMAQAASAVEARDVTNAQTFPPVDHPGDFFGLGII